MFFALSFARSYAVRLIFKGKQSEQDAMDAKAGHCGGEGMTSKAQRRKRKITLPGGQEIDQRPIGRDRSHTNQPEDPRKTALQARCRKSGITAPEEAARALLGTEMGLCINATSKGDELADLTEAWQAISASFRNYRLLVIGQTGDPQGAAIGMVPDRMETDQSLRVDLRTHDERVAAAKASWAGWQAKIKALPFGVRGILEGVIHGFVGEAVLWRDQAPTEKGRLAVEALRRVKG